jgi:phage regulator Rha-like protein
MTSKHPAVIESLITIIRDQRVIVAVDLAAIYGVPTKALNQAVKRNLDKFPPDFMFQLTAQEADAWRRSRSQSVTLKRGQNIKYLPYAFTEHGAIMVANVLKSSHASQMSVYVVRAFVRMRSLLAERHLLARQLAALEKKLTKRLNSHEAAIVNVLRHVLRLLEPPPPPPELRRRKIGFRSRPTNKPRRTTD